MQPRIVLGIALSQQWLNQEGSLYLLSQLSRNPPLWEKPETCRASFCLGWDRYVGLAFLCPYPAYSLTVKES